MRSRARVRAAKIRPRELRRGAAIRARARSARPALLHALLLLLHATAGAAAAAAAAAASGESGVWSRAAISLLDD
jgi:hypothetical protein